jgi:hypothetical protein
MPGQASGVDSGPRLHRAGGERARNAAKEVATLRRVCPTLRRRDGKGPALQGLPMRRRGLEPPPGYPGPGPQDGGRLTGEW